MAKIFNTAAVCIPEKHYMVNIDKRLEDIKVLVDGENYFTINRARQYGKTTTLMALEQYLKKDYHVISMDFQTFGNEEFANENTFALSFASSFIWLLSRTEIVMTNELKKVVEKMEICIDESKAIYRLKRLFEDLIWICELSDKPIVLMIDEVDSATNNQVFLDFLAQLRACYIKRATQPTFQSVILAGVYDVKNLKRKLRPEEEHKVNSPWNIAADFRIDMSFSKDDIAGMLSEYEADYHTGMNVKEMAGLIYDQTSGYPFLVSRLCKLMDEEVSLKVGGKSAAWTLDGFMEADRILTSESNTLFESLIGKVINYPELDDILKDKIFCGKPVKFTVTNPIMNLAAMFGLIKSVDEMVVPANRVFAKVLSDYYLSLDEMRSLEIYDAALQDKNQFADCGKLNLRLVFERFIEHFTDLYGYEEKKFVEKEGRKYFLLYLRPVINGIGHYSMESVTSSDTRTDLIVYYRGELFIIEMKIWHGIQAHQKGEQQLLGYMEHYHKDIGYLLTFNFNKTKKQGIKEVHMDGKTLIEVMV